MAGPKIRKPVFMAQQQFFVDLIKRDLDSQAIRNGLSYKDIPIGEFSKEQLVVIYQEMVDLMKDQYDALEEQNRRIFDFVV